ncbi:hypothetical protein GXN76_07730 [Kroppenstedtia pulmonis]|uniref:DNA ligase (ATP) n=1 Tax=Kroppenstedtia pulmonis TaxID=1380685 RepID=A0A7D4CVL9_9BACL|nr:hypothetical protein [Kroppenstedtia pulmonis]QKG84377.1 hypothetical protein GXN76_07730 [Kroppenstedtia pulmonis]
MADKRWMTPMEPVTRKDIFQDTDFLYQVKWDGVRMIADNSDTLRLINRRGNERTEQYCEIAEAIREVSLPTSVLDGEIVVLHEGKADFYRLLKRELASHPQKIANLRRDIPVVFIVFDCLMVQNEKLLQCPLAERQERLYELLSAHPHPLIHYCDSFDDGIGLWKETEKRKWEGVVMKHRASLYHPGQKHPSWIKIKHFRHMIVYVAGVTFRGGIVNSLLLGKKEESGWVYIGRAGSGLDERERYLLTKWVEHIKQPHPSVLNPPRDRHREITWVKPALAVEVRYLDWTLSGTLRSPTIVGFRNP